MVETPIGRKLAAVQAAGDVLDQPVGRGGAGRQADDQQADYASWSCNHADCLGGREDIMAGL